MNERMKEGRKEERHADILKMPVVFLFLEFTIFFF